jgi:hypothetical protein
MDALGRTLPILIGSIESEQVSYVQGLGPPDDLLGQRTYGPNLRRLPYVYPQRSNITSSFEKLVYYVLSSVYQSLGTRGHSVLSAWGDFHPVYGIRLGDALEMIEDQGVQLLDPNLLAGV